MGKNAPVCPDRAATTSPSKAHVPGGERRRDEPSTRPLMPPDTVQMDSCTVQRRSFASLSAADEMNNEWISALMGDGDYGSLQKTRSFGSAH